MTIATSNITGNDYNLEDLDRNNGTVQHDGTTLYLLHEAVMDYGTDGGVRYYANAIDADGIEYRVGWDTTEEWDLSCELSRLMAESDLTEEDEARIEELDSMGLPDCSDESNACDWGSPVSVQVV